MRYKKVIIIILSLILISLIGFFGFNAIYNKEYVMAINGEKVSTGEYKFILEGIKDKIKVTYGLKDFNTIIDGKKASELAKERASESIINFTIEYQKARETGISLSQEELTSINNNIQSIFSQSTEDVVMIKNAGLNAETFEQLYIKFNTANKYKQKMLTDISKNITISEDEAKNYYTKNIEQYTYDKEMVRAKHILFKTVDDDRNPLPKEQQDSQLKKAQEVLRKVRKGGDFASLAKEYSEDEGSKDNGGEYVFARGDMVEEFENPAFSLKRGEVSDIVKTEFGYHIIKLEAKYEKGQTMNFEEYKDSMKIDAQYNKLLEEWKKNSKIVRNDNLYNSL